MANIEAIHRYIEEHEEEHIVKAQKFLLQTITSRGLTTRGERCTLTLRLQISKVRSPFTW